MVSWHGFLIKSIDSFWKNIRHFSYYNRSFIEMVFVFLYAFEQITLVYLVFHSRTITELGFIVSIFAIIVLTTFSIHKLVMESRIRILETQVRDLQEERQMMEVRAKEIDEDINTVVQ